MKRLSARGATRCEMAKGGKCRCRCGGLLHGKGRGSDVSFFKTLPRDDPHFALPKREPNPRPAKPESPQQRFEFEG